MLVAEAKSMKKKQSLCTHESWNGKTKIALQCQLFTET